MLFSAHQDIRRSAGTTRALPGARRGNRAILMEPVLEYDLNGGEMRDGKGEDRMSD